MFPFSVAIKVSTFECFTVARVSVFQGFALSIVSVRLSMFNVLVLELSIAANVSVFQCFCLLSE